jgi:hypothetical protein
MLLGSAVYNPVADSYRNKLRDHTKAQELSASYPTRQTPRFLSIIMTPNDEQEKRRAGQRMGDGTEVAVLRWSLVEKYLQVLTF